MTIFTTLEQSHLDVMTAILGLSLMASGEKPINKEHAVLLDGCITRYITQQAERLRVLQEAVNTAHEEFTDDTRKYDHAVHISRPLKETIKALAAQREG